MWNTLWIDILQQYKIHADIVESNVADDEVYAEHADEYDDQDGEDHHADEGHAHAHYYG